MLGGRGQAREFCSGLDIVGTEPVPRAGLAEPLHRAQVAPHQEVVAVHPRDRGVQAPGDRRAEGGGIRLIDIAQGREQPRALQERALRQRQGS